MQALARHLPRLAACVPYVELGEWPTPITERTVDGRPLWIKHEGDSHPAYGGNKLRTLEVWFGHARERGARRIWAIGAYGSNHVIATLVHAHTAGLTAGAILFPQPASPWAVENCGAILATGAPVIRLRSVIEVPLRGYALARRDRDCVVMPPGGATTVGTFGALSAAFELAEQIAAGAAPPPARIVVPIGSTCTTAGLLAGLALAKQVGVWPWPAPIVHGVRVTPWPVTSRLRIANLARETLARVETLGGPRNATGFRALLAQLVVDGRELGRGYGHATSRAEQARAQLPVPRLDGVYSAKAAAALLRLHREQHAPLLFWATKATTQLAAPSDQQLRASDDELARWVTR